MTGAAVFSHHSLITQSVDSLAPSLSLLEAVVVLEFVPVWGRSWLRGPTAGFNPAIYGTQITQNTLVKNTHGCKIPPPTPLPPHTLLRIPLLSRRSLPHFQRRPAWCLVVNYVFWNPQNVSFAGGKALQSQWVWIHGQQLAFFYKAISYNLIPKTGLSGVTKY